MGDVPKKWLGCRLVEQSPKIRKKEDKGNNVQEKWCLPCKWCLHACIYGQAKREERGRGRACARMRCDGDGGDFAKLGGDFEPWAGGPQPSAVDARQDLSRDLNPHGPLFSASLSERSQSGSSHVRKVFECLRVCGQAVRIKRDGCEENKVGVRLVGVF